jgi:hypothetical protein
MLDRARADKEVENISAHLTDRCLQEVIRLSLGRGHWRGRGAIKIGRWRPPVHLQADKRNQTCRHSLFDSQEVPDKLPQQQQHQRGLRQEPVAGHLKWRSLTRNLHTRFRRAEFRLFFGVRPLGPNRPGPRE